MSARAFLLAFLCLVGSCSGAAAVDFNFGAYADFRAISPSDTGSWMDGELGKLRFGDEHNPDFRFAEAVAAANVLITGELVAVGVVRIEPEQRTFFDVTEAYLRYRPISTGAWRFTVKGGAFFPPISLENTEIGWTSPWTLTSSAIDTWVGEELRTLGAEARAEWRSEARTLSVVASLYGWNDPAGILIADRGWSFGDRPTGLLDRPRLPDVVAYGRHLPIPAYTREFIEIDSRPGWYAGASWDENGVGHFELLRYDNQADPTKTRIQVAWLTDFWSAGFRTNIGNLTLLTQGMTGETIIRPSKFFYSDTTFSSAYLLAGWDLGDWRLAGRFDLFSTAEDHTGKSTRMSEHGNAVTFAVNWLPTDWFRLTGEIVHVDSTRPQRFLDEKGAPHQVENQLQLSARFYY